MSVSDPKHPKAGQSQSGGSHLPAGQTPVDDGTGVDKSAQENARLKKAVATFDDEGGVAQPGDAQRAQPLKQVSDVSEAEDKSLPDLEDVHVTIEQKEDQPLKHVNDAGDEAEGRG